MSTKKPLAAMPVSMPKARGTQLKIEIEKTAGKPTGVKVALPGQTSRQIYAMLPGNLCLLRKGHSLPGFPVSGPLLVLEVALFQELNRLNVLMPIPQFIFYHNVDLQRLRADLGRDRGPIYRLGQKAAAMIWKRMRRVGQHLTPAWRKQYAESVVPNKWVAQPLALFVPVGEKIGHVSKNQPLRFQFAVIGASGKLEIVDPIPFLKVLPTLESTLTSHGITKFALAQETPITIGVRFEYLHSDYGGFRKVHWRPKLDLIAGSKRYSDRLSADGSVTFTIPQTDYKAVLHRKLYFSVDFGRNQFAGVRVPSPWSSENKYDSFGNPGWYEKFPGISMGSASSPLVFSVPNLRRIEIRYVEKGKGPRPLPGGVRVQADEYVNGRRDRSQVFFSDGNGQVSLSSLFGDRTRIKVKVVGEMRDLSRNLRRVKVHWTLEGTSAAKKVAPKLFPVESDELFVPNDGKLQLPGDAHWLNAGLYNLKVVQEVHGWLTHMTRGCSKPWLGMPSRIILWDILSAKETNTFAAWPFMRGRPSVIYRAFMDKEDHWKRSVILHEYAHLVMDFLLRVTSRERYKILFRHSMIDPHDPTDITNGMHAVIEGWAEFFQFAFGDTLGGSVYSTPDGRVANITYEPVDELSYSKKSPSSVKRKYGSKPKLMAKIKRHGKWTLRHPNLGELVEGAVAEALWAIYRNLVIDATSKARSSITEGNSGEKLPVILESTNGNVYEKADYLEATGPFYPRFGKYVWEPMLKLSEIVQADGRGVDSRSYWMAIEKGVPVAEWIKIRKHLRDRNIAVGIA